jgi:hypothetical protein
MLGTLKELQSCQIDATDGPLGHVIDLYFDDQSWVIRYLAVHTGLWLAGRRVLISPIAVGACRWSDRLLPVSINKMQVRNSPDIDTDLPVSRQHEVRYSDYYAYPYYWGDSGLWGAGAYPSPMIPGLGYGSDAEFSRLTAQRACAQEIRDHNGYADTHLRSCKAVSSYRVQAEDGDVGHMVGLLIDEETWAIRYLIVSTSHWWDGHQVLIAPQWIKAFTWSDEVITVGQKRDRIKASPVHNPSEAFTRLSETELYAHYSEPGYW